MRNKNTFNFILGTGKALSVLILAILLISLDIASPKAKAADLSQFDAGNIISDSVFFNGQAMSAQEIQAFLDSKVPVCTINNGQPSHAAGASYGSTKIADTCLKNYAQQTPDMAAQPNACLPYAGSPSESAATIIYKVGAACGVSQKVLLVLLDKEQSLVSDTWPTVRQFTNATGFACYDNGQPCVSDYAGFFYQVWSAARQFQRYGTAPFTWYPVNQYSNILYQANMPSCGSKSVLIQNRATAALYYYTPYTPNAAALSAGYGTGDNCSAYGNRNFYQKYVDWFGSTQGFTSTGQIGIKYSSIGGATSWLGSPNTPTLCNLNRGGCWQGFSNGSIYWSPNSGARTLPQNVIRAWAQEGYESGSFGYPNSDPVDLGQGSFRQDFEGGSITYTTNGHATVTQRDKNWSQLISSNPLLGMVTSSKYCDLGNSGCFQSFAFGSIYSSATSGTRVIPFAIFQKWSTLGYENGALGYPTSDPMISTNGSLTQEFEGGVLSSAQGATALQITSFPGWKAASRNNSWLGKPAMNKYCALRDQGCYQDFQNGSIYSSATNGVHAIKPAVRTFWGTLGYENGALGYPTGDPTPIGNSTTDYTQTFQGGTVQYTAASGASLVSSSDPWLNVVANNSWLGKPAMNKYCALRDQGCYQDFQNGSIYSSATNGVHAIKPAVRTFWGTLGYENGALGYPTGDPTPIGNSTTDYTQTFQGGTVQYTAASGASLVSSSDPWLNVVANNSWLGKPAMNKYCALRDQGCYQDFQNGSIYSSATNGVHAIKPAVRTFWGTLGYENGALGYPTGDPTPIGNSTTDYTQTFQGGTVQYTAASGASLVSSSDPWLNVVANNSWLGKPAMNKYCALRDQGCYQDFQNGSIYSSATNGVHAIKPAVRTFWGTLGYENGALGYPTGDPTPIGNSTTDYTQTFQGGTITVTNGVARRN